MYPIHDILIQLGIEFVVSKTYSKIVTPFDIIALHPHRYENGLLEIPAIHLNPETDLSDLFVQSRKGLTELKNDLFVGLISPNTEQIEVISQQIEKFGGGVLTFTQVYRHFNTEYETITP